MTTTSFYDINREKTNTWGNKLWLWLGIIVHIVIGVAIQILTGSYTRVQGTQLGNCWYQNLHVILDWSMSKLYQAWHLSITHQQLHLVITTDVKIVDKHPSNCLETILTLLIRKVAKVHCNVKYELSILRESYLSMLDREIIDGPQKLHWANFTTPCILGIALHTDHFCIPSSKLDDHDPS